MATIKAFSVARTQKSYNPASATPASGVYSFSGTHAGRNGAYDHVSEQGGKEGRVPTLVTSGQTTTQIRKPLTNANGGAATSVALDAALGNGTLDWAAGTYIVTTTNQGTCTGAGLLVEITVSAAGAVTIANASTSIKSGGDGYAASGDNVTLDIGVANTVSVSRS